MPVIAARAGVHPTTVYRRWASLGDLLGEVATSRFSGDIVVPDTGSLRGDLAALGGRRGHRPARPRRAGADARHRRRRRGRRLRLRGDRQAQLEAMLERERARGGAVPTVERVADAVLGPLYYRAVFTERAGRRSGRAGSSTSGLARRLTESGVARTAGSVADPGRVRLGDPSVVLRRSPCFVPPLRSPKSAEPRSRSRTWTSTIPGPARSAWNRGVRGLPHGRDRPRQRPPVPVPRRARPRGRRPGGGRRRRGHLGGGRRPGPVGLAVVRPVPQLPGRPPRFCLQLGPLVGTSVAGTTAARRSRALREPLHSHFFGQSSFARHAVTAERRCCRCRRRHRWRPWACSPAASPPGPVPSSTRCTCRPAAASWSIGAGAVGLAAIMAARLTPATVVVAVEPNAARRDLAVKYGATEVIDPRAVDDVVATVHEVWGARRTPRWTAPGSCRSSGRPSTASACSARRS